MNHNLTANQLNSLRWFISKIRTGELEESIFILESNTTGGRELVLGDFHGEHPDNLNSGVLDALVTDRAFIENNNTYTITRRAYEILAFDFENPQPDPLRKFILETYKLMGTAFNREEFSHLCFEMNVNPEWAFGDVKDWPFELLQYLYRHHRLIELPSILHQERPNTDWPAFPKESKFED